MESKVEEWDSLEGLRQVTTVRIILRWAAEQKATRALFVLTVWLNEQTRRRGSKIVTKSTVIIKPELIRMPLKENKQAVRDKRERASVELSYAKTLSTGDKKVQC